MSRLATALLLAAATTLLSSCAWRQDDKCYVSMDRYRAVKDVYLETGSMQRVEQVMEEEQWADCERNQLRYLLRKDLHLEEAPGTAAE